MPPSASEGCELLGCERLRITLLLLSAACFEFQSSKTTLFLPSGAVDDCFNSLSDDITPVTSLEWNQLRLLFVLETASTCLMEMHS
jgi:hypothetical protein